MRLIETVLVGTLLAGPVPSGSVPARVADPGPVLRVPSAQLAKALHCPASLREEHDPVLLVHGITQTGAEAWSWNYGAILESEGRPACTLDLPGYGTADSQVGAEYVVHAVRSMSARSGRKVDLITFSKGAQDARWAVRWWPDLRNRIDDAVLLGAPNHGADFSAIPCTRSCPPAVRQGVPGSNFLRALNAEPAPGPTAWTNIFSTTDEIVFRAGASPDPWTAASTLAGARNIRVQDHCPGRPVEHVGHVWDAVVGALVRDALEHDGPADPHRAGTASCTHAVMPGVDEAEIPLRSGAAVLNLVLRLGAAETVAEEPAGAPYVTEPRTRPGVM